MLVPSGQSKAPPCQWPSPRSPPPPPAMQLAPDALLTCSGFFTSKGVSGVRRAAQQFFFLPMVPHTEQILPRQRNGQIPGIQSPDSNSGLFLCSMSQHPLQAEHCPALSSQGPSIAPSSLLPVSSPGPPEAALELLQCPLLASLGWEHPTSTPLQPHYRGLSRM